MNSKIVIEKMKQQDLKEAINIYDIVEELKPFLTVWNLGVHKDYRRNKIGTAMMNYIYDYAKKHDCDFISLIAEKDNIAGQKFYERLGYFKNFGYVKLINKEKW